MKTIYSFLILAVMLSFALVQALDGKDRRGMLLDAEEEESYKSFLEYEGKRKAILQSKIEQHKERLEAHNQGHRLLADAEHAKLTHQSTIYARHLEQLAKETKQDKLEKIREAKEFHQKHYMSKLDMEAEEDLGL